MKQESSHGDNKMCVKAISEGLVYTIIYKLLELSS
ncbi:hypothetical protein GBAR_LOCUS28384 [Geodia barretti]|uniref:Uncharacterized protein n=1 Tax=Geodia barretti TaxID=519541 RepID=A0AA35XGX1_GEOBA|nr:hypothetical protein GBAR_LOCUS28384 [Geodia barretti]